MFNIKIAVLSFFLLASNAMALFRHKLIYYAEQGHLAKVRELLAQGEDINQRSWHFHNTALMLASQNGHIEVVNLLLEKGADPSLSNDTVNITALGFAITSESPNRVAIVKALINAKADINAGWRLPQHNTWGTPLMVAIRQRDVVVADLLLRAGADFDMRNGMGDTAYSLAISYDSPEIIRLLEQVGAHPDPRRSCPQAVQALSL